MCTFWYVLEKYHKNAIKPKVIFTNKRNVINVILINVLIVTSLMLLNIFTIH